MSSEHFKVIAVGGGPAGIALAVECIESGLKPEDVLILEKGPNPIEAIRKFYPDKKMTLANYKGLPTVTEGHIPCFPDLTKIQTLEYFDQLISKYRLNMRVKSEVYKVSHDASGLKVQVGRDEIRGDIVSIGIGILGRPNKPTYKLPNSLRAHLLFDVTSQKLEGQRILIVGGGDTSSEYAQVLVQDANVITMVIRAKDLSRMMESNQKALTSLVEAKKVRLYLETELTEVQDQDGKPLAISSNPDQMPPESFDKILFAIGGTTPINFLLTAGVDCENNWPKYSETGSTNIANLYLSGDLVAGKLGGSIITAYNSAFRSVQEFYPRLK